MLSSEQSEDSEGDREYLAALAALGIKAHRPAEFGYWHSLPRCYCGQVWPCASARAAVEQRAVGRRAGGEGR